MRGEAHREAALVPVALLNLIEGDFEHDLRLDGKYPPRACWTAMFRKVAVNSSISASGKPLYALPTLTRRGGSDFIAPDGECVIAQGRFRRLPCPYSAAVTTQSNVGRCVFSFSHTLPRRPGE